MPIRSTIDDNDWYVLVKTGKVKVFHTKEEQRELDKRKKRVELFKKERQATAGRKNIVQFRSREERSALKKANIRANEAEALYRKDWERFGFNQNGTAVYNDWIGVNKEHKPIRKRKFYYNDDGEIQYC